MAALAGQMRCAGASASLARDALKLKALPVCVRRVVSCDKAREAWLGSST